MTRIALPHAIGVPLFLLIAAVHCSAQPWRWDFGNTTASCTQGVSTTLLPAPASGSPRVRIGSQGGSVSLVNPGYPLLGSGSEVHITAPSGGSLNKLQLHDFQGAAALTVRCSLRFGGGAGTHFFFVGNGGCFADNGGFTSAEIFTGLRWEIDSTGTVQMALRDATTWRSAGTLQTGREYLLELYCNNGASARSYTHDSVCTVSARRLDVWIDGTRIVCDAEKSALSDTTAIDSFMLYAANSAGNSSVLAVDDIHYDNDIAANPLPVELRTFRAHVMGMDVRLTWTTDTELNNHGFFIERRPEDRAEWDTIAFVAGAGTSNDPRHYVHVDSTLARPGSFRYRLRQRDRDGSEHCSPEVHVAVLPLRQGLTLHPPYPHPANDILFFRFSTDTGGPVSIRVRTLTGVTVAEPVLRRLLPAGEHVLPLPCAAWPRGVVLCEVHTGNACRAHPVILR
jgi:hypothetical protein